MCRLIAGLLSWVFAVGVAGPAFAQGNPMIGYWSGSSVGTDGVRKFAMSLNLDESYVSVLTLPNGTTQRVWGKYRWSRLSPTDVSVTFNTLGWLPYQTCVPGIGRIPRCTPFTPISPSPVTMKFAPRPTLSPDAPVTFAVDGSIWTKALSPPPLLSKIVPDHLMLSTTTASTTRGMPPPRKYGLPP